MKVAVTGVAGYIGSVLARQLLSAGHEVFGIDCLLFGGESLISIYNEPLFHFYKIDVRKTEELQPILSKVDAVIHLAAIVGDPACKKFAELAEQTNWVASKALFNACNDIPNIKRFIFASTCSNYGKMEGSDYIVETSPLKPISLYAELKVKFEQYLMGFDSRPDFIPTALRFATVYGLSPRMRFDLTVNEFMRESALGRVLEIFGEQFWRPYCHVEDLAIGCITVLNSPVDLVNHEVFNVGDTKENYQKKMIAEEIQKILPEAEIKYVARDDDPRDYRVSFAKIASKLNYKITKTVPDGLQEVYDVITKGIVVDPYDKKYGNT